MMSSARWRQELQASSVQEAKAAEAWPALLLCHCVVKHDLPLNPLKESLHRKTTSPLFGQAPQIAHSQLLRG